VYVDGKKAVTLQGTQQEVTTAFLKLLETYVASRYEKKKA